MQKPVVLIVLDGWGLAPPGPGNAISLANLTNIPRYWVSFPHTQLVASGESVGLPPGEDGNTETGHINIGAGRVVYQDLPRITMAIANRSFYENSAFLGAFSYAHAHTSNVHILGLLGDGGVHSKLEHLFAFLELAKEKSGGTPVYLHLFTDGRDSAPNAAIRLIAKVEELIAQLGVGTIATICGRYYAMDRDHRWERTEIAYRALTERTNRTAPSAKAAIEASHQEGKTDEFVEPVVILDSRGKPAPRIQDHDAVLFLNYRIDRPRQLTKAFVLPDFETGSQVPSFDPYAVKYYHKHVVEEDTRQKPFTRAVKLSNLFFVTMTEYERNLPVTVAFPPGVVKMPIGRVISDNDMRQLRMAETEKERFVTYYFNGMREEPFPGEDRIIVPSAKVATYDLKPEMCAVELTEKLIDRLNIGLYAFILINFANPDMVAHTGNIQAAVKACQTIDTCVGRIVTSVLSSGGACVVTSDHGNVEEMLGSGGEVDTEHSIFPVPMNIISAALQNRPIQLPSGKLADVAPTVLALMGLSIPADMTGRNLLADVLQGETNMRYAD